MIFTAPWVLVGLAALPGLYFLLRLTPPSPRRIAFPPLLLLRGLAPAERAAQRMPLWLLLLRLAAAVLVILGLAGPALHPPPALPGRGPVLLVIDNGWAAAGGSFEASVRLRDGPASAAADDTRTMAAIRMDLRM